MPIGGDGTGPTETGGTKDGEVRSSHATVEEGSTNVDLKAIGYNVDVDQPTHTETESGTGFWTYVTSLAVFLVVLSVFLYLL